MVREVRAGIRHHFLAAGYRILLLSGGARYRKVPKAPRHERLDGRRFIPGADPVPKLYDQQHSDHNTGCSNNYPHLRWPAHLHLDSGKP